MVDLGGAPVLFLVPGDPEQRTGGYRYVSRLVDALNQRGSEARVRGLEGRFPIPDSVAGSAMDSALSRCRDGAHVVLDGLAMGGLPQVVEKHAGRLRITALVHHPLADETGLTDHDKALLFSSEARALAAVGNVVTTSQSTALRLEDFGVSPEIVRVVEPGADTVPAPAEAMPEAEADPPASVTSNLQILCVAGLSPRKAQHQLVEALAFLRDLPWHCTLVGSIERDPEYSQKLAEQIRTLDLDDRISLAGEQGDDVLARYYSAADLFVLPSVYEGYGMVIDEALAAGLPIITTDGGALVRTGNRPGIRQYPAGSVECLRECLRVCMTDRQLLLAMANAARQSSASVRRWSDAAEDFEQALNEHGRKQYPEMKDHSQFDREWLRLREPADHRARNRALLYRVQSWLAQRKARAGRGNPELLRIVDLGTGAGSNGVCLSEAIAEPQHWTLLDQDPSLLAEARARLAPGITGKVAGLDACECTLAAGNLAELIPGDTMLITASALIDLVSASWLDALADASEARGAAVYIVLSYAGEFSLSPEHPDDGLIRALVNDHQHGNKGSGAALGPEATDYLQHQLDARGYGVAVEPSPWILDGDDRALQAALISGWCEAAMEQCPAEQSRIGQWQSGRLALAERGGLRVQVGHHDLFAWPPSPAPS